MLSRTAVCINHQMLSRTNVTSQKSLNRMLHITCKAQSTIIKTRLDLKIFKYAPILGTCSKRYSSTTTTSANVITNESAVTSTPITNSTVATEFSIAGGENVTETVTSNLLETIPDAPLVPDVLAAVSYVGEPPLSELGLGAWTPPGLVQQGLEIMHVSWGLPWWETIMLGTLILRVTLFPLVVKVQRNAVLMTNNMPAMTRLQSELQVARSEGDQLTAMRKAKELQAFMKENKCNPLKNAILPLAQAPIFISVFLGLRKMAELPVESFRNGGLWWFTDLTVADPYYILPLITCATLALTIELGTDSARPESMGLMRYVLRSAPYILFPFIMNFPTAVLCYWTSTNFISLFQVGLLRIPKVRKFFKIQALVQHSKVNAGEKKGFVATVKTSFANMKAARDMNTRYVVDEVQFQRAGRGPLQPTFKYDPTKRIVKKPAMVMAKKS